MHLIDIAQHTRIFRTVIWVGNRFEQPRGIAIDLGNPDQLKVGSIKRLTQSL